MKFFRSPTKRAQKTARRASHFVTKVSQVVTKATSGRVAGAQSRVFSSHRSGYNNITVSTSEKYLLL